MEQKYFEMIIVLKKHTVTILKTSNYIHSCKIIT